MKLLSDDEYILYKCWKQINDEWLYKSHDIGICSGSKDS